MPFSKEEHLNKIQSIVSLYNEVKNIIALAEYTGGQEYIISSANELRSTLDHLMKTFDEKSAQSQEIDRAKGHLYRAGFDAYEVIASNKLITLNAPKNEYGYKAVSAGFPEYFTKIVPLAINAQERLAKTRSTRIINDDDDYSPDDLKSDTEVFKEYECIVTELLQAEKEVNKHIFSIQAAFDHLKEEEEKEKKKLEDDEKRTDKREWRYFGLGVVCTIIVSFIVGIILINYEHGKYDKSESTKKDSIHVPTNKASASQDSIQHQ